MNQEIKKLWVDALRSGRYEQGVGVLRDRADKYCCLGVLCELAVEANVLERAEPDIEGVYSYHGPLAGSDDSSVILLPVSVMHWAGLEGSAEVLVRSESRWGGERLLSGLNDSGETFEYIASVIEEEL